MAATTTTPEEDISTTADEPVAPTPKFFRVLESIQTGSGDPIFSEVLNAEQTQNIINSFVSQQAEITDEDSGLLINFSNDLLIIKTSNQFDQERYYSFYEKGTRSSIEANLQYNYNMTTSSVKETFSGIFNSLVQEIAPPKTSRTFTYDFKFSQNQNGSITTGSVRPVRTRAARSSGGGGY